MRARVCGCVRVCAFLCAYVCACVYVSVCVRVSVCVCACVCVTLQGRITQANEPVAYGEIRVFVTSVAFTEPPVTRRPPDPAARVGLLLPGPVATSHRRRQCSAMPHGVRDGGSGSVGGRRVSREACPSSLGTALRPGHWSQGVRPLALPQRWSSPGRDPWPCPGLSRHCRVPGRIRGGAEAALKGPLRLSLTCSMKHGRLCLPRKAWGIDVCGLTE